MLDISYVVSAKNRPWALRHVLLALFLQTHRNFEIIVVDNAADGDCSNFAATREIPIPIRYFKTEMEQCYDASDFGAERAKGEFLCFPSDDSEYCPLFGAKMLDGATLNHWDFVYCRMMFCWSKQDQRYDGKYFELIQEPKHRFFDKTGFIVRRDKFPGFRKVEPHGWPGSDGYLAEWLVNNGVTHGRVEEILAVHNA